MGRLDAELLALINGWAGSWAWLDFLMVLVTRYLVFVIALLALVPWVASRLRGRELAMRSCSWRMPLAGALAAAASFVGNWAISLALFRDRPFVALEGVNLLISPPLTGYSFPSSHSATSFAVAFTVVFFHRRYGLALAVAAALVAFSRVYVGVHFPLDVLVGSALGVGWAALFARIFGASVCLWQPSGQANVKTEKEPDPERS